MIYAFFAAVFAALANFIFRKNSELKSPISKFLLPFYLMALVGAFLLQPSFSFSYTLFLGGVVTGVLNVLLMHVTARALLNGPSGLTYAFQNVSAVFPGFILYMIFGTAWGFSFSLPQFFGLLLVVGGIFLGAREESSDKSANQAWLKYAISALLIQVVALTLIQGRCILFSCNLGLDPSHDGSFMPGLFGAALLLQKWNFDKKVFTSRETLYGLAAGLLNFGSTWLLLTATESAKPTEQPILFPIFCVFTILFCNVWATCYYKEKFKILPNTLASAGVLVGIIA